MANVKLKDGNGVEQTYNGVSKVILKDTDNQDVVFEQAQAGTTKVSLSVDNTTFQTISVPTGSSIAQPTSPTKSGYVFVGWSSTSGATIPDINFPLTINNDTTLYAVFNTVIQLKASPVGYGNSSPSSVSFSTNANLINWTPETITQGGVDFIKIPTMYRKITATSSGQITGFIISSWKEDNDFVPYPVFIDEGGNLMPYVLMSKANFGSNATPSAGRTSCRNKGSGYQMYDTWFEGLWKDLICAKMQKIDINSGSGISTDVLGLTWGSDGWWVDGVSYQGTTKQWAICYKPSKYVDQATGSTNDYQIVDYTVSGSSGSNITALGYDTNHPFFNYPKTLSGSSFTSYYCDACYLGTGTTHPVRSYVGGSVAGTGAFDCSTSSGWSSTGGVRLCYRPITQ